jgi:hypothetical protein
MRGGWRKMHNEELHNLYTSSNIVEMIRSRRMRLAELLPRKREMKNAFIIFIWKPE